MPSTQAALDALALLALSTGIVAPGQTGQAYTDHDTASDADLAQPSPKGGPDAKRAVTEVTQRLASPTEEGAPDFGRYVGDLYRMMVAYEGFRPAKAALDELCATQAPGLILAVYRPGDVERDTWCVAPTARWTNSSTRQWRSSGRSGVSWEISHG